MINSSGIKEIEIVNEILDGIHERQLRFQKALQNFDPIEISISFNEEVCEHLKLLPDIVSNPEAKAMLLECTSYYTAISKFEMEKAFSISDRTNHGDK